jgi:cyanocobalamin reductase (cyanide-eliminating) / alkylcobalamin dealkylase
MANQNPSSGSSAPESAAQQDNAQLSQEALLAALDPNARSALRQVRHRAQQLGFRLCHLFPVGPEISALHPFPKLGMRQPLALLLANDATLWPLFEAFLAESQAEHPLDSYVTEATQACVTIAQAHGIATQLFHGFQSDYLGHQGQQTAIPIQRLAQGSGFAALGPAQLCAHPEVGPWFGLRAVIVFGVETTQLAELPAAKAPCQGCAAPCQAKFETARQITAAARAAHAITPSQPPSSLRAAFEPWLAIRDACPIGRAHRYSDDQISYHYSAAFRSLFKKTL